MNLISGVLKEDYSDYVLYFVESLSDELKQEIRSRLSAVCHGVDQAQSAAKIYSYKETAKEFVKRYKSDKNASEKRKKGMIGELLVHIILEIEGRFTTASPFFNMEERSFKKGYDVALFEEKTNELWIAEVKSGEIQKNQKDASAAATGLINTAKNDLKVRLNDYNTSLWLNALNAAKVTMSDSNNQKDAVIKLLEKCSDDAVEEKNSSNSFNVVLSATLFHPISEPMEAEKIGKKHLRIVNENLFKKVLIMAKCTKTNTMSYNLIIKVNNTNVRRNIKLWQAITENRILSSRDGPTNRVPESS